MWPPRTPGTPQVTQASDILWAWMVLRDCLMPAASGSLWISRISFGDREYLVGTIETSAGSIRTELHAARPRSPIPRKVPTNERIRLTRTRSATAGGVARGCGLRVELYGR